jgi:hypothetical protein
MRRGAEGWCSTSVACGGRQAGLDDETGQSEARAAAACTQRAAHCSGWEVGSRRWVSEARCEGPLMGGGREMSVFAVR